VVANNMVTEEDPKWVMALNGEIMATGAGVECIMAVVVTVAVTTTALMSIAVTLFKPKTILRIEFLRQLFDVSPIWLFTRSAGMVFILMAYFQVGPQWIRSENTGSLVLNELMPVLFSVFILAGLLLPLLLNFGLFEK